ncbi:cytochrome c-type biogenesis protein CcmH [Thalassotalea sp. HSM 43]|uniref:cytochrome c-type biogenesis protein n=1 Tax=Thalassotalea sp. HSM 43 TaxID=2552945 RepID=UPI0010806D11|nr:cytochrome c-type biogenesis protein [Thalassotalea sp. HSM 43]QBY04892.1 cytochrome c-type biogenesis protein CcmH [Thalassotalea sp. HSM 43]
MNRLSMAKSQWMAILTLIFAAMAAMSIQASPIDTYEFPDEVMKKRFAELNYELRCPKCQNQNLADSNSPIAADLRKEVYTMLLDGRSDSEIMNFMVERYGEYVLYRPKVNELTYALWFGPAAFVLIGLIVVISLLRKKQRQPKALSAEQQKQLEDILKD